MLYYTINYTTHGSARDRRDANIQLPCVPMPLNAWCVLSAPPATRDKSHYSRHTTTTTTTTTNNNNNNNNNNNHNINTTMNDNNHA